MDRRETQASSGKIWNWLAADGRPVIFKFAVCEDRILLPYSKVTSIT